MSALVRVSHSQHLGICYFAQRHLSPQKLYQHLSCYKPTFQFQISGSQHCPLPTELPSFYASCVGFSQVANLACSISNNEEGVKLVRMAATQIDSLCPQVSKTLYNTTSQHIWMCFIHNNCFLELKLIDDRPINTASWMEETVINKDSAGFC